MSEIQAYKPHRNWELKVSDLTPMQRREARAFLVGCFGQRKDHFTGKPLSLSLLHEAYDLHHLVERGTPGCNLLINLRLATHSANANSGKPKARSGIRIQDKDRIPLSPTEELRKRVDYSSGSKEMQANAEAEPEHRRLLYEKTGYGTGSISKDRAINGFAELIGVSPQAARDYLKKATSEDGPFEEYKERGTNEKRIRLKKGWFG